MLKQNRFGQGKLSSENLKNHDAHTQKMLDTPLCSGFGQYHSDKHATNPQPYTSVTLSEILALLDDPQQVDKATAHRKHDYQVNFAQALSKMKNILIELLLLSVRKLQGKLEALIDYIACTIEPIRRGRSYSRTNSKSKNRIFYCNYKRAK